MTRRRSLGYTVATTVFLWLSTVIAAFALWPIYQSTQLVIVVGAAMLLGTIIAILGSYLRWPAYVVVAATIAGYFVFGVPLAIPAKTLGGIIPTLDGERDLALAAALSWKQLVTITIPVGSYQALLVPALILVLVTTVIGFSLALRSRWPGLAVLAPAALFIAGTVFGPIYTNWPVEVALALLASLLVWIVWMRAHSRRASIRLLASRTTDAEGRPLETASDRGILAVRTWVTAALIIAIAGVASVAATDRLPPTTTRDVIRTAIEQPFTPRRYPSPLSSFRRYEQPTQASSAMLEVSGLPTGGRLRIATLDTYNGVVYSVGTRAVTSESGSFTRVPYTYDQGTVAGSQVALTVTVGDYSGVWLPTIGQFESIDFTGDSASTLRDSFYYNNVSGTAAVVTPLARGDKYSLTAVIPTQPSRSAIAELKPGSANVPRIGVLPDDLSTTLDTWTRDETTPGAKLTAMIAAMKKNGYISHGVSDTEPASRSGHAADRITELLTDQRMIGDQEQYAVTAALMARQLGFPARVVFGFAPSTVNTTGLTTIRGDDISAWIEVDTAEYGWVTIDPTPPVRDIPEETPVDPTTIARPQSPVQPPIEDQDTTTTPATPDTAQDNTSTPNEFLLVLFAALRIAGWVLLALAVLAAPFAAIVVAKIRRRMLRRKAPTAKQRITGGWQDFEDSAVDHGYTPPPLPTRSEVAATVGGRRSVILASVADRAAFSPGEPPAEEADQVGKVVDDLRASFDARLTRWQRLQAAISLRSLGGYSVKNLFKR
ncbi:transglutaminase-like domain-containing protein [soil metagenome]